MKIHSFLAVLILIVFFSCKKSTEPNKLLGTWNAKTFRIKKTDINGIVVSDTTFIKTGSLTLNSDGGAISSINPNDSIFYISGNYNGKYRERSYDNGVTQRLEIASDGISFYSMRIITIDDHNLLLENITPSNYINAKHYIYTLNR